VIEGCAGPRGSGVAIRASCGEADGGVRRRVGPVVIGLVAANAGGGQGCVVVIYVTLRALHSEVGAGERKGPCGVIERGVSPAARGVAHGAVSWVAASDVIGIRGPGEIRLVAGVAGGWS